MPCTCPLFCTTIYGRGVLGAYRILPKMDKTHITRSPFFSRLQIRCSQVGKFPNWAAKCMKTSAPFVAVQNEPSPIGMGRPASESDFQGDHESGTDIVDHAYGT